MRIYYLIFILLFIILYFRNQKNYRDNIIIKFLRKSDKILDFGCGSCCFTKKLQNLNYDVEGVDVVSKGTCYKPKLYNGKTLNYENDYFDVVICSFVLHHIPNYKDILKELIRVTKKYIIIFEDTPNNSLDRYFTKLHAKSDWGKCENCFKSVEEWLNTFKDNNLNVIYSETIPGYKFPFAVCPLFYPVPNTLFVVEKQELNKFIECI